MASIIARAAASGALICALVGSAAAQGLPEGGLYSIGDPSNVEQYQLELINRARMYPQLEGRILRKTDDLSARLEYAYFRVRLDDMEDELSEHLPMPPLAFNAELADMAFLHAIDMRDGNFQGHVGSDGSTIRDRADRSGYEDWTAVGENVFSYASTASHAHASFEVDWGEGPGGMQPGRPHRVNIHSGEFKEVGIAQVTGDGPDVGPQIVLRNSGTEMTRLRSSLASRISTSTKTGSMTLERASAGSLSPSRERTTSPSLPRQAAMPCPLLRMASMRCFSKDTDGRRGRP